MKHKPREHSASFKAAFAGFLVLVGCSQLRLSSPVLTTSVHSHKGRAVEHLDMLNMLGIASFKAKG